MAPKAGAVYRCRIVNIFGNRAVASQQDNRRQRKLAPYVDSDDRPHGQVWQAEPHEALSLDQAEHAQRPVQDTIGGIENPQPRDGSDRNRRNPRKKHEEAEQPFSAKVLLERQREGVAEQQNNDLGKQRKYEGVLQCRLELGGVDYVAEVAQADETQCAPSGGRVADAIIEGHEEWYPDKKENEKKCGSEQEGSEPSLATDERHRAFKGGGQFFCGRCLR